MGNKSVDRRNFLKLSTVAGAGLLFVPDALASVPGAIEYEEAKIPMRSLGKTGVKLPILSMGVDRPDSNNVLRAAFNSGIIHFDTAHRYQNGRNEEMIGNFFNGKPRSSCFIATKVMFDYPLRDDFEQDLLDKLEISLKRLKIILSVPQKRYRTSVSSISCKRSRLKVKPVLSVSPLTTRNRN